MIIEGTCNKRVLVAQGLPPEPGTDGRLEILIDISGVGKPKKIAGGRVDHKELKKVINVKKGDKLIRRIPPQPGNDGNTVFGIRIKTAPSKEALFRVGVGTEVSEDDPNILIAAHDGAVKINSRGEIEVRTAKVITGDIDYSTGNISFSGDLKIQGTVRGGFTIQANGNLLIGGSIEDAQVSCSGDMEIIGGAVGSGNGKIDCGGTLKVHHIENFDVKSGKRITVSDTILHSSIKTEEYLEAKTVVGGQIEASQGIYVDIIGASSETRTVIKVGSAYLLIQEKKLFQERAMELNTELIKCKEEMYNLVNKRMDDNGCLTDEDTAELEMQKEKRSKIIKQLIVLDEKIAGVNKSLMETPNPVIKVKKIFPVTVIRVGLAEKTIREKVFNVSISASENKIIVNTQ
jgi:uncharacterized protein (DUF342 family)